MQGLQLPTEKGRQLAREKVLLLTGNFTEDSSKKSLVAESQSKNS